MEVNPDNPPMEPLNAWWTQMARICQDFVGAVQQIGWIVVASWCLILAGGFKCFYLPHAETMFLLWHFTVLYYIIFILYCSYYYIILYYIILYYIILYYTILYYIILYYITFYYIILYYIILYLYIKFELHQKHFTVAEDAVHVPIGGALFQQQLGSGAGRTAGAGPAALWIPAGAGGLPAR